MKASIVSIAILLSAISAALGATSSVGVEVSERRACFVLLYVMLLLC